jgi:hypothetical protein
VPGLDQPRRWRPDLIVTDPGTRLAAKVTIS